MGDTSGKNLKDRRRRRFLRQLGGLGGAALVSPLVEACRCEERTAPSSAKPPAQPATDARTPGAWTRPEWFAELRHLSPDDAEVLEAMLERLLPGDASLDIPGARVTRSLLHLDAELGSAAYRSYAKLLHDGARRLEKEANHTQGGSFASRSGAAKDELLAAWQRRPLQKGRFPSTRFFELVFTFGLEGYLGDPKYQGNYQTLAWRWIDFEPGCPTPSGHCGSGSP